MRQPMHNVEVHDSELLSVSPGTVEGKRIAILTFRLDPEHSKHATNIAIPVEQAVRLRDDIQFLTKHSPIFQEALSAGQE